MRLQREIIGQALGPRALPSANSGQSLSGQGRASRADNLIAWTSARPKASTNVAEGNALGPTRASEFRPERANQFIIIVTI